LQEFVIPGGSLAVAQAHMCRTICRRAERAVLALSEVQAVTPAARHALNRLSDLMFVLARVLNVGHAEAQWGRQREHRPVRICLPFISLLHPTRQTMNLNTIGVIGAGTMGNGIAQVCAVAGLKVVMIDVSDAAIARGLATLGGSLERLVKKDKLSATDRDAALARVQGSTRYEDLHGAQLVIEAATENLELKLRILRQIDALVGPETVIATNTSSLSITQLAAVVSQPERVIGMHFFNPVPLMALLEVIRGLQTSDATHALAVEFAQRVGKTPISVKNNPGFVVNRILCPMINEAIFVLAEGVASADDIDAGMKLGCNQPIGPLALADMIGLDTLLAIMQVFCDGFNDPKYRPAPLLKEMVAAGRLGRKSGQGFFAYA
jgi:3-hydroxybutyryl-CoA dehydrogenase